MGNLTIYDAFKTPPAEALKKIGSGSRIAGFTNISPMWRIKAMTEQFGVVGIGWYYEPVFSFEKLANDEVLCFCDLNLYIKSDSEWSKPIFGSGGSKLTAKESKGLYNSDEAKKMALSDALGTAMKALGMGADIYMGGGAPDDGNKYDKPKEKGVMSADNYEKYKGWLDGLEMVNDITELKKYYLDNEKAIEEDSFLMDVFSNKKAKLEAKK